MTPRTMSELSLDLYLEGLLCYDEYEELAFEPELHPEFDRTIGALTGRRAAPDHPRDYVEIWTERLLFEHRHSRGDPAAIRQSARILAVLQQLSPTTPAGR